MVNCQLCDADGHDALACPTLKGRSQAATSCQICKEKGHSAKDCPKLPGASSGGGGADGGDESDDDFSDQEECPVCGADDTADCPEDDCPMADHRAEKNLAARRKASKARKTTKPGANAGAGAAGGADGGGGDGGDAEERATTLPPKPAEISKMNQTQVAALPLKAVLFLPDVWQAWIYGVRALGERTERHRRLFAALRGVLVPSGRATADGKTALKDWELEDLGDDIDALSDLLDPAAFPLDVKGYQARIGAFVGLRGFDLLATKDVAVNGWAVVRSAKKIFRGESQQPREWGQAIRAAQAAAKTKQQSGGASPTKGGGKQQGRWRARGGKGGGRGAGGGGGGGAGASGGGRGGTQ